jgi:hypothetical protein
MSTELLDRRQLTAALAARQGLLARFSLDPVEAIRRLTPLQAQHPPAPYVALAARVEGFTRDALEQAIDARQVVKTTLMRNTLHLVAADEYPAYAELARQARLRSWRRKYEHLDEERVVGELREWLREPRTNHDIRDRVGAIDGVPQTAFGPIDFARTVLPLVQLAPAGHWSDARRPRYAVDPRRPPSVAAAAMQIVRRYLAAFGPAARADAAAWAGVAQRDLTAGFEGRDLVRFQDEAGRELYDLRDAPRPPGGTHLPVRLLARWDQALLAHADRERIIPSAILPHALTLSGDQTVTVDGRVAATWRIERERSLAMLNVAPLADFPPATRAELREEAERTVRLAEPSAERVIVCFE